MRGPTLAQILTLSLTLAGPAWADDAYRAEVERFRAARTASLKADDGWLSVSGLAWVRSGETRIGGDPSADVLLPEGAPPLVGILTMTGDKADFQPGPGVNVLISGKPFAGGTIHSDAGGKADVLAIDRFRLILLKRGDRFAIRIKDNQSEIRRNFTELRWFPIEEDWKLTARFVPHPVPTKITFETIVGERDVLESPGYATFDRDGTTYRLDAAAEPDGRLWFVFRDATSGRTTPANSRQLTTDGPVGDTVILDFNKAVNLPCAYTPHATCPIAPPQNRLKLAVTAGEKTYQPK